MTLALLLFMAWRQNTRNKAYLYWGLGFLLSGTGFAMVALRGEIPNILSIEAGNAIALLGQSAWVAGFMALDRKKIEWWALLPPAIWLAGVYLPWVHDDYGNRVILYNLASATGATGLAMAVCGTGTRRRAHASPTCGRLRRPGVPLLCRGCDDRRDRSKRQASDELRRRGCHGERLPVDDRLCIHLPHDHGPFGKAFARFEPHGFTDRRLEPPRPLRPVRRTAGEGP